MTMYTLVQIQTAVAAVFDQHELGELDEETLSELVDLHLGMVYCKQAVVDSDVLNQATVSLIEKCLH